MAFVTEEQRSLRRRGEHRKGCSSRGRRASSVVSHEFRWLARRRPYSRRAYLPEPHPPCNGRAPVPRAPSIASPGRRISVQTPLGTAAMGAVSGVHVSRHRSAHACGGQRIESHPVPIGENRSRRGDLADDAPRNPGHDDTSLGDLTGSSPPSPDGKRRGRGDAPTHHSAPRPSWSEPPSDTGTAAVPCRPTAESRRLSGSSVQSPKGWGSAAALRGGTPLRMGRCR